MDLIGDATSRFSECTAFTQMGAHLSYQALTDLSDAFANYVQQVLGLVKGDRIAIMLPNVLQFPVAFLGALKAGLILTNINPLYTVPELHHQLQNCGARAILILENSAHLLEQALPGTQVQHVIITELADLFPSVKRILVNSYIRYVARMIPIWSIQNTLKFREVLKKGGALQPKPMSIQGDDIALLQYTGGTTGTPKGAELTHRNLVSNTLQSVAWVGSVLEPGKETVLVALPLYHIFSLTVCCLSFMCVGARGLLIPDPRNLKDLIKTLHRYHVSIFLGLNTLFHSLLMRPAFSKAPHGYKLTVAGGMPTHQEVAEEWEKVTGSIVLEGYGLTEMSPIVTINPTTMKEFNHSIGLPLPNTEVSVRDQEGQEVVLGEAGELYVRGPQRMKGYWQNEAETRAVIDSEGWLATGDMVRMDEQGFLYIVGRKKDLILVSGFKVFPGSIEDVLESCPKVAEAAVIGVEDPVSGEAVKAFVVKRQEDLTKEELLKYCHEQLTGYRMPKYVEFVDSLPKSAIGKVLYRELRKR